LSLNQEYVKYAGVILPSGQVPVSDAVNVKPSQWKNPGAGIVSLYSTENGAKVIRGE